MARKPEFGGPTVGVRLTPKEAQVVEEMRGTLGPVKLSPTDVVRLLFREGLEHRAKASSEKEPSPPPKAGTVAKRRARG